MLHERIGGKTWEVLFWSRARRPVVHVRPTVLLEGFFLILTPDSVRESNQIRLPFGEGKTSPVAVEDVARVLAAVLANPQPHIGKIYHLPVYLVHHLATMADRTEQRYDRMSDDVLTLAGQGPLSMQEFVRNNAATFTASAKVA